MSAETLNSSDYANNFNLPTPIYETTRIKIIDKSESGIRENIQQASIENSAQLSKLDHELSRLMSYYKDYELICGINQDESEGAQIPFYLRHQYENLIPDLSITINLGLLRKSSKHMPSGFNEMNTSAYKKSVLYSYIQHLNEVSRAHRDSTG